MGRKRKYQTKTVPVCISVEQDILEAIEKQARRLGLNKSEFVNRILTTYAFNKAEYCRLMARRSAQELYYWKSRLETLENHPELFEKPITRSDL